MNFQTIYKQNPQCPVREIGGGLVIMAPAGETTHALEDLGLFIWNQLDGKKDLEAVLAAVLAEYDVQETRARDDLERFITQLQDAGLVLQS